MVLSIIILIFVYHLKRKIMRKYVYVRVEVQDGERTHIHHSLIVTECESIWFAAMRHVAQFYDNFCDRIGDCWYFQGGEVASSLKTFKEITAEEYNTMFDLMY